MIRGTSGRRRRSWTSAPTQAVAAGFTTLAFFDDFTSASTITGNASFTTMQSGIKWYPGQGHTLTDPTHYHVLPSTMASGISNGNTGGGSNSSPNGGILQITGISAITNQGDFISVPQALTQTPGASGCFGPTGYWEGYMQFNSSGTEHVAMWTYPATTASIFTEPDIVELNIGSSETFYNIANLNQWSSGSDIHYASTNQAITRNSEWHTFGMLIVATGGGQATFSGYLDNALVGSITVGTGTNYPTILTDANGTVKRFNILGKDVGADVVNFDWFRYWGP